MKEYKTVGGNQEEKVKENITGEGRGWNDPGKKGKVAIKEVKVIREEGRIGGRKDIRNRRVRRHSMRRNRRN